MIDRAPFVRPSSLGPLEICHGRAYMEARAVALVPLIAAMCHPQAAEGINGHLMAAQTLALIYHGQDRCEPEVAFARMQGATSKLSAWTREAVRRCVAYAVALVERETQAGNVPGLLVEMKLGGTGILIPQGGTADVVIVVRDRATGRVLRVIIVDWKLGFLDQGDAADHVQLGAYGVMGYDRWPADEVEVHLAQGRLRDFTAATYDRAALDGMRARCRVIVANASADAPELTPSIHACRYCKALPLCRAAREYIMHAAQDLALFGVDDANLIKLADDVALANRFVQEGKALAKAISTENQAVKPTEAA